ncbi:MFS transporter [Streptococcus castoreus]|uniref:MFS transporter n=1 Tax=Streptococcus castoreus TaxID=254786 RepID=UPI00040D0273|nr:glycoside-pentoside-hexuronide (GPH):cation symporter [Streptococcus castoreus]
MAIKKEFGISYNDEPKSELSFLERFAYGTGDFAVNIVYSAITTFLLFYYTDVVKINPAAVGSIMLFSRLFDGVTDIIMGIIVDRTKSRFGKARVWLSRLAIPYAISAVVLFAVPMNASETFKLIYIFLSYNLTSSIILTGIVVPYSTMNAMMTQNQYERTLLGTFRMLLATCGTMFINTFTLKMVAFLGNTPASWTWTFAIFGTLSIIIFYFSFLFTHERVVETPNPEIVNCNQKVTLKEEFLSLLKNKYWVMVAICIFLLYFSLTVNGGTAIYYAKAVLNNQDLVSTLTNATTIAQIGMMFVAAPLIVKRIGKGKSMALGMAIMSLGYAITALVGSNVTLIVVSNIIKGLGAGVAASCMWGMLSDTIEYGEWKTGIRSAGLANAASSFGSKVGSGVAGAVLGWVMSAGGYDAEATTQSASAIAAVSSLYIYIPLVLGIVSVAIMYFGYKLDTEYDRIIAELETRNTGV